MALSVEDFVRICRLVCPHCRAGVEARKRSSTGEWQHNALAKVSEKVERHAITTCWAGGLRDSEYAPAGAEGAG